MTVWVEITPGATPVWSGVVPVPGNTWSPSNNWVLATGYWDDTKAWDDTQIWADGPDEWIEVAA